MGAEQSKGSTGQANKEDLLNQYDLVERIDHDVQVLRHKQTGELVGVREYNLTDETEFQKVYDSLQPKQALQHSNIIRVLLFEFVKNTLHEEIKNRQELQQQFNEDELWNILSQSISGINYLYQSKLSHSNISPSTILITDSGIIKVADPQLLSQLTLYADALTNRDHVSQETYLSPELLAALYDQEYNPRYNQQRSDVFSLGMTVLSAAILEPLNQAYDYKNCTIDEGFIIQKLLKAKSIYGSNLYNFLSAMVVMTVDERQDLFVFDQIIQQKETQQTDSQQLPSTSSRLQETSVQQKQQQVDQQNQQPRYISAEPARQSNYSEIKFVENSQIAPAKVTEPTNKKYYDVVPPNPTSQIKKEEEQPAWRSPANPNVNAPKPRNAASMYRDTGDNGSKIQYVPADSTVQKSAVPDQSGGNAIGQTAETERKQQQSTQQQQVSQQEQYQQQYPNSYQTSGIYNQKPTLNAYTSPAYSATTNQNSYTPPPISTYTPPVVQTNIPIVPSTYTTSSYQTPVVSTQNPTSSTTTAVPATVTSIPSVPVSQTQQNTQITTSYTSSTIGNQNPTPSQVYTPPVVPAYTSTYTAPTTSVSNTYTTSTTYSVPVPIKADYSIKNYGYEVSATNNTNEQSKIKEVTANNAIVDAPKTNFTYDSKVTSNQTGITGVNTYVPYTNQVSSLPNQSNTATTTTTTTTSYSYQIPNPLTQLPATSATGNSEIKTTNTVVNNPTSSLPSALTSAGYSESSKPSSYTYTPITQDKQVSSISVNSSVPPVGGSNTSTQQQAATTTFQLNSYTTPISIEEAIKKSAPPPLKNYDDILPASSYTGSSGVYNNLSVPVGGSVKTGTYQTSVAATTTTNVPAIVSTTFTADTSNNNKATTAISSDNSKPHDEIEAILARYRNKTDNQQATTTTTTTTGNTKVDYYTGISSNTVPAADAIKTTTTTTTTSVNVQPSQSSSSNAYSSNTGFTSDVNKYTPISYQLNPPSDSKPVVDSSSKTQNAAQLFGMTSFEPNYEVVSGQFGTASNTIPVNSFSVQSNYNAKNNFEDEKIKKSSADNSSNLNSNNTYVNTYVNSYYDSKAGQQPEQQQQYQTSQGNYQNNYSSAAFGVSSENGQQQQQQDFYGQQYNQGSQYEGQYDNQEREYVVENYQNDSKYEGEKLNGMRDGRGKFYYQDGGLFDGEWSQNKMHGKGVLSYASGKPAYDGDWIDDKFDGFGILYNENPEPLDQPYNFTDFDYVDEFWVRYEGQFKEDNKEGFGTLYLSNGERFEGQFFQDFVNGQGVFFTMDGQQLQGVWNQNKLVQE